MEYLTHPQSRRPSVIVVTYFDVTFYVYFVENVLYKEIDIFSNSHTKSICGIKN